MNTETIEHFLNTRLSDYASYDNLRKIASYIDGLKNASRKVLYTIHDKKIKETEKVSRLASKCSEYSDYLHGDGLWRVIVTLGQDYAGTNNVPLIQKFGAFGCRSNNEPGAPRYIHASGSKAFFEIFKYEDDPILIHQTFEGADIEPRFYVPTLPMILVNGSEGVSSGFAQKILPRNPKNIVKYIQNTLLGKPVRKDWLMPFCNGFSGSIEQVGPGKFSVTGTYSISRNTVTVSEIPFTYDLPSYLKVLDSLEDSKVINSYRDLSDGDNVIKFEVKVPKGFENPVKTLKIEKTITENYTCIDENNKIRVFSSPEEIIESFIRIKTEYTQKRKEFILKNSENEIRILRSKVEFVSRVLSGKLKVNNVPKDDVVRALESINTVITVNGNYNYLLGMPIFTLTKEKVLELKSLLESKIRETEELRNKQPSEIWLEDLRQLKL